MYTIESLNETFERKHQETLKDPLYGDEIKPLFNDDGTFNRDNWNSFQADIRSRLERSDIICCGNELHIEHEVPDERNNDYTLLTNLDCFITWSRDQWHIIISIICDETELYDSYVISWYKSRGRTEMITKNGVAININEYVDVLNKLEDMGFFNTEKWRF